MEVVKQRNEKLLNEPLYLFSFLSSVVSRADQWAPWIIRKRIEVAEDENADYDTHADDKEHETMQCYNELSDDEGMDIYD